MSTSVPPPGFDSAPAPAPVAAVIPPPETRRRSVATKALAGLLSVGAAVGVVLVIFSGASSSVTDPIAQAATLSSSAPGYRMNIQMTLGVSGLSTPLSASGNAIVDLRDHAASMSMGIDFSQVRQVASVLGSSTLRFDMILDRRAMYIKLPAVIDRHLPGSAAKPWISMDFGKLGGLPGLSSLGNSPTMSDPTRMLQYLRAESSNVTAEGQQQVDGFETTHYHAVLSLDRVAAKVPPAERAVVEQALATLRQSTHLQGLPMDVWIDSNHLVRRIMMSIDVPVGPGDVVHETVIGDVTSYGPEPRPALPPANEVQDLSNLVHVQP